jgi:AraC family transcriptional activator of pobA
MTADQIPRFFLYGEPHRDVGDRFLHLESIDDRTRPENWNIRPHAHINLNHLFFIREGGGRMFADAATIAFEGPCLLSVPCNVVHGFHYRAEAQGSVVTISEPYLQDLMRREAEFRTIFACGRALPHTPNQFDAALADLSLELSWTAPGHASAVEALLLSMLVGAVRLIHEAAVLERPHGAAAALVARFRELVEANYRTNTQVESLARTLGVSAKRLRAACLSAAGATPLRIIQDRLLLEAKRLMLYSNMTVTETAYYLGFDDPAYFTRFFAKGCGLPPRRFRKAPPV